MRIGELARRSGVAPTALGYYERGGERNHVWFAWAVFRRNTRIWAP